MSDWYIVCGVPTYIPVEEWFNGKYEIKMALACTVSKLLKLYEELESGKIGRLGFWREKQRLLKQYEDMFKQFLKKAEAGKAGYSPQYVKYMWKRLLEYFNSKVLPAQIVIA